MSQREMGHEPETIIAASVKVEGDLKSGGDVVIEGEVMGSLTTKGDLRVGEQASIDADVTAVNAHISGQLKGNLTVAEKLELSSSARISGDVNTKILIVESGATVNGLIVMGDSNESHGAKVIAKAKERVKETESETAIEKEKDKRTINAFFTG